VVYDNGKSQALTESVLKRLLLQIHFLILNIMERGDLHGTGPKRSDVLGALSAGTINV
jgi:hypothetical protein